MPMQRLEPQRRRQGMPGTTATKKPAKQGGRPPTPTPRAFGGGAALPMPGFRFLASGL